MKKESFAYRSFIAFCFLSLFLFLYILFWKAYSVILLAFAGILFGIFLNGISRKVSRHVPISYIWSLVIVVLLLTGMLAAGVFLMGPGIVEQLSQLAERLPQSQKALMDLVGRYEIGRKVLEQLPPLEKMMPSASVLADRVTTFFSNTLYVISGLVIVFVIGIYLAARPYSYRHQISELLPPKRRAKAKQIMDRMHHVLWWWLLGRVLLMVSNGLFTTIGLWILGVPLALSLGVIAGLLNFIPNIGPLIGAIPAVLIALIQSPALALKVMLLYLVLQTIDGYVLTPIVDREAVSLPAAFIIFNQLIFGILMGFMGVLLATPLATAIAVLVQTLYVEEKVEKEERKAAAR